MKPLCNIPAIALAAAILMAGFCPASSVPTEWTVRVGPRSAAYQAERRHGDALALKASLVYNGQPLAYSGPARLYAQTNGMGATWWDLAPCTVSSNVLQATWLPSFDTGADVVDLFLGGPSNYQAAARIRFLPSPGAVPNSLPLPVPVLDFAQVVVTNAPFATFGDISSATNDVLQSALRADAQSLSQFAATGTVARALTYGTPTRWTDATGCVWEAGYRYDDDWVADSSRVTHVNWTSAEYEDDPSQWAIYFKVDGSIDAQVYTLPPGPTQTNSVVLAAEWLVWYEGAFDFNIYRTPHTTTNLVGRVALTNDIPNVSGYATQQQATNAAIAVADAKISTNNTAFVSAVLAAPLVGADASDIAELSEYGSYGTVGAAILALIAGLAALKRRMGTAETALAQKASLTDLPYAMATPGEWEYNTTVQLTNFSVSELVYEEGQWVLRYYSTETGHEELYSSEPQDSLELDFAGIIATRPSLHGHLLDRAVNAVSVSGATPLTLPALVNAGKARDFLVRLEISGSTVPTITFAAPTGETITYETDGDEFPVPDAEGTWLYSFTETAAHTFAVSLKRVNEVAAPLAQGGS